MRRRNILAALVLMSLLASCGGNGKEKPSYNSSKSKKAAVKKVPVTKKKTKKMNSSNDVIDLKNKGIGPISTVSLGVVEEAMVTKGKKLFKTKCSSCHRTNRKFIGPNPTGILKRRSPEWIMNMIMNPEEMVQKDPIAKQLFIKYNGSPMANQNLTEKETRAVLEYFRTLN